MGIVKIDEKHLTNIANAIRNISGTNNTYKPREMANVIASSVEVSFNEDELARAVVQKYSITSVCAAGCPYIKPNAFRNMPDLVTLDLPDTTYIGYYAIWGCTSLKSVILRSNTVCEYEGTSFGSVLNNIEACDIYVYVPAALVASYKAHSGYSVVVNRIRAIEDYPEITGG